ncbi:MAG: hypothetical protein AAB834_06460 [Patescibacteria group bacterium]
MPHKQDLEPLLSAQQSQLNLLFGEGDNIDTKALAILGANIAIIIFIAQASLSIPLWQTFLVYSPFLLSLGLNTVSIWPRGYIGAGIDLDKSPQYLRMDRETLLLQLLADTQYAIKHNSSLNKQRLRFCVASILLTGLGFVILLAILKI